MELVLIKNRVVAGYMRVKTYKYGDFEIRVEILVDSPDRVTMEADYRLGEFQVTHCGANKEPIITVDRALMHRKDVDYFVGRVRQAEDIARIMVEERDRLFDPDEQPTTKSEEEK